MRAVAVLCFFLSGASGLVFEVIWTRMFGLVFGATTLAISTVLTAFMGGLALGSFLAGRLADRMQDTLKAYAIAEAGIGASALAVPLVVANFGGLNQWLYQSFSDNYLVTAGVRFLASAAVMVVPTTLMGATLPLLSRLFVQTHSEQAGVGMRVGALYAVNTFGAVIGTALGGFVLLPRLGLSLTNTVAGCTNISLALLVVVAYQIRRRLPAPPPLDPEVAALLDEAGEIPAVLPDVSPRARTAALVAFGFSGAVAMIYQVIWTRTLNMAIGSSVYSFTIVLCAFLVGLAGGAAVVGRLASRSRDPVGWLAINHLAIVVLVGLSYLLADKLPFVFLWLIRGHELRAGTVMGSQFLMALLTMLPATLAMGGVLPLTVRIYASGLQRVGYDVGSVYSINTVGAIIGSFMAGFVVIPLLQLQPGMLLAVCVNLSIAAVMAWFAPWGRRRRVAVAAAAGLLLAGALVMPRWNLAHVTSGLFRLSIARDVLKTGRWTDPKLVYHRDGISTSVTVEMWSSKHFSLKNNGKVDASTGDDMPTQIAVGLMPILLHPRVPELRPEVALIGYASGVTAGAILQYPVKRLDVVELEPAIMEGSVYFNHVNHKPLSDRRLRLLTDDGRNFLAASAGKYDVIVNEPSNPWITGVSNLFTREYFEIGKRRLKPDGIFCTWAQAYEISPRSIKIIYRTFAEVFPHVCAFSSEPLSSDTFLIGSLRPLRPDIRRLRRAFAIPTVGREMARAKIERADDLLSLLLLGPGEVRAFTMGSPVNTDDNALIEFKAPQDMFDHKLYDYYVSKIYGQFWQYGRLAPFVRGYRTSEEYAVLVRSLLRGGKHREARLYYKHVRRDAGPHSLRAARLMDLLQTREVQEAEVPLHEGGGPLMPPRMPAGEHDAKQINRVAKDYAEVEQRVRSKLFRSALDLIEEWPEEFREQAGEDFQLLWGYLVYKCTDFYTAANILGPLWENKGFVRRRPALLYYLGRTFFGNADYAKAIKALEQWIAYRVKAGKPVAPPPRLPLPDDPGPITSATPDILVP
jgi:spermidine synthase